MANEILNILLKNESVSLSTNESVLYIFFKSFYLPEKEFLFMLNATPVYGCKTKKTALKKI
jgi:hypothetical protein